MVSSEFGPHGDLDGKTLAALNSGKVAGLARTIDQAFLAQHTNQ